MKYLFSAILLLCKCGLAIAHNGQIVGKVIDVQSKQAIESVQIYLMNKSDTVSSDFNGKFTFSDLTPGNYTICAVSAGYRSATLEANVTDYSITNLEIPLQSKKMTLQEITITKNPERNKFTINQANFNKFPINSSQDILKVASGLFIAQHAGGGKAEQIFIRGFDCDHGTDIALHVDGMPVNMVSHAHGQGYADLHFIIPELIDHVSVNKGPYLSQVGNFATAGSMELTTKSILEENMISIEKGMYNNNRILAMGNLIRPNPSQSKNFIAAVEYNYNKGYFESPMNLNRMNAFLKYNNKISKQTQLSAQVTGFNSKWNASGQIPIRAVESGLISNFGSIDSTEGGNTSRLNFSVNTNTVLKNESVINQQIFYNRYAFNLYSNFTFFKNDTVNGDMIQQQENRSILGYNGRYIFNKGIRNGNIKNTFGIQARIDLVPLTELSNVKQRNIFIKPISKGKLQESNYSAYYDALISLNNKWYFQAGIRYDLLNFNYKNLLGTSAPSQSKGILSPKSSIHYNFNKKIQLFAQFGKGFHSNDTRVVTLQNGKKILPSAYGLDLGWMAKPTKNTYFSASAWILDLQQEFVYVGDEAVVEVGDATRRRGLDFTIKHNIRKRISLDLDINYAYARILDVPSDENKIALAPPLTSTGGISYFFKKNASVNLRYRHLSDRPANEFNDVIASGYTLADLVLFYPINRFDLTLSVENLLNSSWREAQFETETQLINESTPVTEIHYTSGTPINARIKLGYRFK